jgi:hypothetical protein
MIAHGAIRGLGIDVSQRIGEADLLPFTQLLADKRKWEDAVKDQALDTLGAPTSMVLDTTADADNNLAVAIPVTTINNAAKTAVAFTVSGIDGDRATATASFTGISKTTGAPMTVTVAANAGTVDLSNLADGTISTEVTVTDVTGNVRNLAGASIDLDTTADVGSDLALTINDLSINNAEKGAVAFSVTGLDGDLTSATASFTGVSTLTGQSMTVTVPAGPRTVVTVSVSSYDQRPPSVGRARATGLSASARSVSMPAS